MGVPDGRLRDFAEVLKPGWGRTPGLELGQLVRGLKKADIGQDLGRIWVGFGARLALLRLFFGDWAASPAETSDTRCGDAERNHAQYMVLGKEKNTRKVNFFTFTSANGRKSLKIQPEGLIRLLEVGLIGPEWVVDFRDPDADRTAEELVPVRDPPHPAISTCESSGSG